jgi:uncharacterized membrane protein
VVVTIAVSVVVVAAIGGLMLMMPRLAQPVVPFGVRVPPTHAGAPAIRAATRWYTRRLVASLLGVIVLLGVLAVFSPGWVVIIAAVLIPWAVFPSAYLPARQMVLVAREQERWYERSRLNLSLRTPPPSLPWLWALPAVAVIVTTVVVGVTIYPSLPDQIAVHISIDGRDDLMTTTPQAGFGMVVLQIAFTAMTGWECWAYLRREDDLEPPVPIASTETDRRFWGVIARYSLVASAGVNASLLFAALMMWGVVPITTTWLLVALLPVLAGLAAVIAAVIRAD